MTKNVNLRKASAIQKEIQNYLSEIVLTTEVKVPLELAEAKKVIKAAQADIGTKLDTTLKLQEIVTTLRDLVSTANTTSGVSTLLAKENLVKNQLKTLEKVKNGTVTPNDVVLKTRIEKASTDTESHYGSRNTTYEITVGTLTEDTKTNVAALITNAKRSRNKINESILALNVKTEVKIDDADYAFLESLGIV